MTATVGQTLDYARSQLGTGESPDGSNCNPYSHALGKPCEPWCADFATHTLKRGGLLGGHITGSPAARVLAQQFKDAGQWYTTPRPGDLAFFIWDGDTVIHHVEFVESVRSSSEVVDIGGNVGNKVTRTVRRSHIVGYGRPNYAKATPTPAPKPSSKTPAWYKRLLKNNGGPKYMTGPDVGHVQRVVGAHVDNIYGPKTASRVGVWQKAHHVTPVDGIVGPITAKAMG